MSPYKQYPWGYIGQYQESKYYSWYAYHTATGVSTGEFETLLEAECALQELEFSYRLDQEYVNIYACGYSAGWNDCLKAQVYEPFKKTA